MPEKPRLLRFGMGITYIMVLRLHFLSFKAVLGRFNLAALRSGCHPKWLFVCMCRYRGTQLPLSLRYLEEAIRMRVMPEFATKGAKPPLLDEANCCPPDLNNWKTGDFERL
jgi:hypothetical protein